MTSLLLLLCLLGSQAMYAQAVGKRVLIEKITSAGCPSCPDGTLNLLAMTQADPSIIVVAVHVNNSGHRDSMACPDGNALLSEYLWAHPTGMIDRVKWSDYNQVAVPINQWQPRVDLRQQERVRATVGGVTTYDSTTRQLTVQVQAFANANLSAEHRLNAYVVERTVTGLGLGWDQLNGQNNNPGHPNYGLGDPIVGYVHHWVLRDMLGGHHGEPGTVATPAVPGDYFTHTFTTTLDPRWDDQDLDVVVLIQRHNADPKQREILNAQVVPLNASVAAAVEPVKQMALELFPNPAQDAATLRLPDMGRHQLSLHDAAGRQIRAWEAQGGQADIMRQDLPAGLYLLRAQNSQGEASALRLIFQ